MSVCTITATTAGTEPLRTGSRTASARTAARRPAARRSIPADRSTPAGVQPSARTPAALTPVPQPTSRQIPLPGPSSSRRARPMPSASPSGSSPPGSRIPRNSSSYQSAISSYAAVGPIRLSPGSRCSRLRHLPLVLLDCTRTVPTYPFRGKLRRARMTEPAIPLRVCESIEQVDRDEWAGVTGAADAPVFYDYRFLRAYERAPLQETGAFFYLMFGRPAVAVLPAYIQSTD